MMTPKRLLRLTLKWLVLSALVLLAVSFVSDELSFQYRLHSSAGNAFGSVDMQRVLAIELKGGKVEYALDREHPAVIQTCVNSLFPHAGYSPCWYLVRQSRKAETL